MLYAKLNTILEKETTGFIDSLQISGIDVLAKRWSISAVEQNAQAGAKLLIHFATSVNYTKLANAFLQITMNQLDAGQYFSAIAWIYAAYDCFGCFPPYGIIQHAVDDTLLEEYCVLLRKWLNRYYRSNDSNERCIAFIMNF